MEAVITIFNPYYLTNIESILGKQLNANKRFNDEEHGSQYLNSVK